MITEALKRPVVCQPQGTHMTVVPLDSWGDLNRSSSPEGNFLEWVIQERMVLAGNCSLMGMLGWGILGAFQEAWVTGHYDPRLFDRRTPAWLRVGDYRLHLAIDGSSLTVQRGNKYGRFVDTQNFAGDWARIAHGLKTLGVDCAAYPVSCGRVAAGLLKEYARPLQAELPREVFNLSWQACKGSRMEAITLGTFDGVAYDISSAFPFAASNLPWAQCRWVESTEYRPDAFYGFAEVETIIPDDLIAGPIGVRMTDSHQDETALKFPVGKLRVNVCQPEMALLTDMGIPFKIKRGWWGYPTRDIYPFEELMQLLWDLRAYDKAGAKSLSVACVGQLGSVLDDGGDSYRSRSFFNPVYFAHIYADTRCRVYRKALEVGLENVSAFTIDGVITWPLGICGNNGNNDVNVALGNQGVFGEWRVESEGRFFIANDYFKDRPDESDRWRQAVAETPRNHPEMRFEAVLDNYVGVRAAMSDKSLREHLGGFTPVTQDMPLGSDRRRMPKGVKREDFLKGEIRTI